MPSREYPYQDPDYEVPNQPVHGDPAIKEQGTVLRPSAERMPFGPSGELLPEGAALPVDFSLAPDIVRFPQWTRRRGQEWTDSTFRALILAYIGEFFAAHDWATAWQVEERKSGTHLNITKYPNPILVFRILEAEDVHEVVQEFPPAEQSGAGLTSRLAQVTLSIEALRP